MSNLIVVGQGAAGLAAALSAAEDTLAKKARINITLIEKAAEGDAGGNTRWSPSYMRMASPDRVEPSFVHNMLEATRFAGEEGYFARLAEEAPATVKWIAGHGIKFHQPDYYLAKGPPRIQPVGGGPAIIQQLSREAKRASITIRYGCAAKSLVLDKGKITGITVAGDRHAAEILPADAVVLACGGFEGNGEMMRAHFGAGAEMIRLISPGTKFNTGDGIRMADAVGAQRSGDWGGMHAEPVDARDPKSAPVVLVYPYGIVVDKSGRRFFDEGGGLVHETWERFAREIHFKCPGGLAFAILDVRLLSIEGHGRAIRSDVPPFRADTVDALARLIGLDAAALSATIAEYNSACTGDPARFDATRCDGLAAAPHLKPAKSNWARSISVPPFLAYPLAGAVAYTFGGIATDERARVLRSDGVIAGLYAAGEITGHFHHTAPNAVSVLRAFVFGRIAGREAVRYLCG